MPKPKSVKPERAALDDIHDRLEIIKTLLPQMARKAASETLAELLALARGIDETRDALDPIKDPGASFDPADSETAGRLVALALMAQDRVPLARVARTYGSGVYAIYYNGSHPAYMDVAGTETPVYIGKADPKDNTARTSKEQGPQLYGRLADHRRMIVTVGKYATDHQLPDPLRIEDFECRRLVCASHAQLVAERHLIGMFKPIWNNEVGLCWGISKHGDSAKTRMNKRSPWDVMHPGRPWAMAESLENKMSVEVITQGIVDHLLISPPYESRDAILNEFLIAFMQKAAMTTEELALSPEAAATVLDDAVLPE